MYSPYEFAGNTPIWAIDLGGLQPWKVTGTARKYIGTPYEYGAKNPVKIGGYPFDLSKKEYLNFVKPGPNWTAESNPNYDKIDEFPFLKKMKDNQTLGIDCSGHAVTSFNSDEEKLMGDFSLTNTNAKAMRSAFANAEKEGIGFLSDDFSEISEGDMVFNPSASHVMVANGKIKKDKDGKITHVGVINTHQTGSEVDESWYKLKKGSTFGHTNRTSDNNDKKN